MPTTQSAALIAKSIMPGYTVNDLDRSIAFYEALGFTVKERWEENGKLLGVMVQAGQQQLGLNQDDWKKGRDRQKGIGTRLHIETLQNIDDIAARVKAAGFKLDVEPFDTPFKTRQFEVTDPSGFKLTISSEWPSSWS
ncbi:MAG TPA: VOC family protein [Vicinamibacterales bacterium]|nr:VOC family protein [Vicinamibacterales bacterium]